MKKSASNEIKRGQAISFRIPSDTPDHLMKQLQKLKETERRNFSSKIAQFVLDGVSQSATRERETITIPLPHQLTKAQRDWLKHEHSEALLGSIVYHLLTDPVRATSLFTSLNSNSLDINEALYLDEEDIENDEVAQWQNETIATTREITAAKEVEDELDDIEMLDWDAIKASDPVVEEPEDEIADDLDSLLGDFLAKMNK